MIEEGFIETKSLHSPEMVDAEIMSMLGKSKVTVALGHVILLARTGSAFICGGTVTPDDYSTALDILQVEDYDDFGRDLSDELDAAWRVYDIILPPVEKMKRSRTIVETWSPEWLADMIGMVTQACPSLALNDILWHVPFTMILHLWAATIRRNGGDTRRPEDLTEGLEALKKLDEGMGNG